jgi:stress-induced morphogen
MPSAEEIKQRIEAAIPGAVVEIEDYAGDSNHFRAVVTSEAFEGLGRIQQHRIVYSALDGEVGGAIHALTLKTSTPTT